MKNSRAALAAGIILVWAFGDVAAKPRDVGKTNGRAMSATVLEPESQTSGEHSSAVGFRMIRHDDLEPVPAPAPAPTPHTPNPGGCYEDYDLQMTICN